MNTQRDPDAILAAWLEDGPSRLPDATRRAIGVATRSTDQRRRPTWASWRLPDMNSSARLAVAAIVVVAVGAAGFALLGPGLSGTGTRVSPAPSQSSSPVPTSSPVVTPSPALTDISNWVSFTSTRYGYTISHPPSWTATAADKDSTATALPVDAPDSSADHFIDAGASYQILVTSFAVDLPPGMAFDDWITSYYTPKPGSAAACSNPPTLQAMTVDGHPGTIALNDPCSDEEAFVLVDGRIHSFGIWRENQEALFQAFLSTVQFPSGASASASPRTLASEGFVYPGRYVPAFGSRFSFTIDREVEHNCAPQFTCRGSIDVNTPTWLGLEFGQPAIDVNVVRLDKVYDPAHPGRVMDPPADLAGWIAARPGLGLVSQQVVRIDGISGTQLDLRVDTKDVTIAPIPGVTAPPAVAFPANAVTRVVVLTVNGHRILIITHAADGSLEELQPLVESITWG